ncbi:MAG TPA: hypothetical protein VGD87_06745, partial [Archangium sp.]
HDEEYALMRSAPDANFGGKVKDAAVVQHYRESVATAELSNIPLRHRTLRVQDLMPEKNWRVLASLGYLCDDPYTGTSGVEKLDELRYRVTTRLYTHNASSKITFTFRLKDSLEDSRLIFSPLLVRFLDGEDYKNRPVKISDSGRIRNELQTLISQALQYDGERIRVHFDRIDDKVLPRDKQKRIREILEWYRAEHPVWFSWLDF